MSSNKNWPSMFKSKPCNNNHHHQHEIDTPSYMHYSNCNLSSSFSSDRVPDPKPRWNPKPEQIRILESIFNSGTVNPPREEIQRIRIRLQEYGQIGDANVFYWFQNRKSRAKHKLRVHHKNPKMSKKDKMVISSNDADHCFGFVNQETGIFPVQNNELVVTEPAGFLFPVHNDPSAAQTGFGFSDFVVPVVTEEGMAFSTVNNGVNLETDESFDHIPAINLYGGDGNGGGNCFSPLTAPLTVPLAINQSQDVPHRLRICAVEDCGVVVQPSWNRRLPYERPFHVADRIILGVILDEALENRLPPNVLLASSDSDFTEPLRRLRSHRYKAMLAADVTAKKLISGGLLHIL
ncbi:Homeobox domain [Arabidopsis suecica]|uniref:Homeobox domain n=1 Tax=Arabidopsis suecica TaxID=45249 RepID=A0A8T1XN36_ARASU|nr:Homeobox domain [Arabidopsis suecica]